VLRLSQIYLLNIRLLLLHWRKHHWCGDSSRILLAATSAAIFPMVRISALPIVGISALQWSESVLSNGWNQCSPMVVIRALRCLIQHGKRTLYLAQFLKEGCVSSMHTWWSELACRKWGSGVSPSSAVWHTILRIRALSIVAMSAPLVRKAGRRLYPCTVH
jgi:hypothetical protein